MIHLFGASGVVRGLGASSEVGLKGGRERRLHPACPVVAVNPADRRSSAYVGWAFGLSCPLRIA